MKRWVERVGIKTLHCLDPEVAHGLALAALRSGLAPLPSPINYPRLATQISGLKLPNPIGLAAGFDKNAEAVGPLLKAGFGFVEIGAVTPLAQPGNPKPRLFRLTEDQAVINRFGFNNIGMNAVAARLEHRPKSGILGINLGANKQSEDRAADFGKVLKRCAEYLDFATINVSSPNTERLRDLQGADALKAVLGRTQEINAALPRPLPLFVKIAPDLDKAALDDITQVAEASNMAGIIATNTTISRAGLKSSHAHEMGGLSGRPLFDMSTAILAELRARTGLPLIGVGGISSGADAYAKIRAGASAIQLYSALTYHGLGLINDIAKDLDQLLVTNAPAQS